MTRGATHALRARGGFSLVELLVAIAVLTAVSAGIMLAFTSSLSAMKTGYQAMDATEQARAALDVMQRDVNVGLGSRRFGDYYTFYGNPIGFTFVGVVDNQSSALAGSNEPNLARITYVVYMGDAVKWYGAKCDADAMADGDAKRRMTQAGFLDQSGQLRATFYLVRYVEFGQKDLDNYPEIDAMYVNAYGSASSEFATLRPHIVNALDGAIPGAYQNVLDNGLNILSKDDQALLLATKRELWIRMLAGDPYLPNIWTEWPLIYRYWGKSTPPNLDDYIVATNIASLPLIYDPNDRTLDSVRGLEWLAQDLNGSIGQDAATNPDGIPRLEFAFKQRKDSTAPISSTNPLIERQESPIPFAYGAEGEYQGGGATSGPTNAILSAGTTSSAATYEGKDLVEQPHFWGDVENAENGDLGSPLRPRLPQLIMVKFRFLFPSAYVAAPDYDRAFSRSIALPAGEQRWRGGR